MAALAYAPRIGPNGQARRTRRTRPDDLDASTTLRLVAVPAAGEHGVAAPPVAFRPVIVEQSLAPLEREVALPAVPAEEIVKAPSSPVRPTISHEFERRVLERRAKERRVRAAQIRRRRLHLVGVVASVGLAAAIWFGISAVAAQSQGRLQVLPGSVKTAHGYLYRVQPGDTVWSIATELDPNGDPRSLVGQIESEIGGTDLQAGTQVLVP
jgi:hypothetical protein